MPDSKIKQPPDTIALRWKNLSRTKKALVSAATIITLLILIVGSEAVQGCIDDYKYHYRSDHPRGAAVIGFVLVAAWRCLGTFFEKNGETLIALFTIALAVATYLLWRATVEVATDTRRSGKQQARLARKALKNATDSATLAREDSAAVHDVMKAQQAAMEAQSRALAELATAGVTTARAFVFLSTPDTAHASANRPITDTFLVRFVNLGQTPGYIEVMDIATRVFSDLEEAQRLPAHIPTTWTPVGAWVGSTVVSGTYPVDLEATLEQLERRSRGQGAIVLVGRVRYSDVFGNRYENGFIYHWLPNQLYYVHNEALTYTRALPIGAD